PARTRRGRRLESRRLLSPGSREPRAYSVLPVSGGTGLAAILALLAGLAGSVQAAVMGRFGERIGTVEALAWASLLSLGLGVVVLLVVRSGGGALGSGR